MIIDQSSDQGLECDRRADSDHLCETILEEIHPDNLDRCNCEQWPSKAPEDPVESAHKVESSQTIYRSEATRRNLPFDRLLFLTSEDECGEDEKAAREKIQHRIRRIQRGQQRGQCQSEEPADTGYLCKTGEEDTLARTLRRLANYGCPSRRVEPNGQCDDRKGHG